MRMEKENYEALELEIIAFEDGIGTTDAISASGGFNTREELPAS